MSWLFRFAMITGDSLDESVDEETGQALANCPFLRLVTRIKTGYWEVASLEALARSPHLVNLVDLEVKGSDDDDTVALAPATNPALGRLRRISCAYSTMSARGIMALAISPTLNSLIELDLPYNHAFTLGDCGQVAAFQEAIQVWERHRGTEVTISPNW
jgi:hypothetical protein